MNPEIELKKSFWKNIWEWAKVIVVAILISLPIRYFIVEPFIVNGASMDPTFSTGQFLLVDRLSYRFENPERGDVIVFKYPNNPSVYYIKRIIGLPGETIDIETGKVNIKNASGTILETLSEPYVSTSHISSDSKTTTLSKTQYFVMGDNRIQSSDSRIWGPLKADLIVGRPMVRLYPPSWFPGEFEFAENINNK
jgi:signal peptidase I